MLKIIWYICLLALTLGQFGIVAGTPGSAVYAFDIFIIIFDIIGLAYFLVVKKTFKIPVMGRLFICFFLATVISLLFSLRMYSFDAIVPGLFYLLRFSAYVFSGIIAYNMAASGLVKPDNIRRAVVFSGILISLAGIVQLILLPDFSILDPSLGWDPHKNRLASTFFDPNFTGVYLVVCLALLFDKYYVQKKFTGADFLFFIILLVPTFLTFSRSAWAMLAVVVLIYGRSYSKKMLYASLLVAFCAYFSVPRIQTRLMGATDPSDSARLRIESWKKAGRIISDNPVLGVGFNNYKIAQKEYGFISEDELNSHSASGTDSSLLFVLATTGIIGFAVYLVSLALSVFIKGKLRVFSAALVLGLLVDSLFINSLFYPQIMFLIFLLIPLEEFSPEGKSL